MDLIALAYTGNFSSSLKDPIKVCSRDDITGAIGSSIILIR